MLPTKFRVNWPFGSGFGTILAIFDLQVTLMLPTKTRANRPFGSGEEANNRLSRWPPLRPSWIFNQILAIFDLQTPMLPTKFGVNWSFGSEEVKNRFLRWPWRPF